ncbi:Pkinase domain-containing protein, partial [Cephalotus follicularis]
SWVRGKCIGKGSFGTVSIATHKRDGAVFAVKSVDQNSCRHLNQLLFLENEIRHLRSLSSPYIVQYLGDDVSHESSTSYRNLHLEYMPNGTVADLAGADAGVDDSLVRSRAWCVVSALRYIHARGIAHCDVKGRNILVGPDPRFCKLADFGSSTQIGECTGKILPRGSPLWMAPEVVRGELQGTESDVWSLGCTIIEMITGKPAWDDRGVDTLNRIGFSTESPELPTGLSPLCRDFIEKCLKREPSQRWSCDQLLQHPFLLPLSPVSVTEPSPRCVLDWDDSGFESDEDGGDEVAENCEVSAMARMGKLATNSWAIWESDGWVTVRSGDEKIEYSDFMRRERETSGTSSVYSDLTWIRE